MSVNKDSNRNPQSKTNLYNVFNLKSRRPEASRQLASNHVVTSMLWTAVFLLSLFCILIHQPTLANFIIIGGALYILQRKTLFKSNR